MEQSISILGHLPHASKHYHLMRQDVEHTSDITILDCEFQHMQVQCIMIEQLNISKGTSLSIAGLWQSFVTQCAEHSSISTFPATARLDSLSFIDATHSLTLSYRHMSWKPSRICAGSVIVRMSSHDGQKGGNDFAFHPTVMALRLSMELIFHNDQGLLLLAFPQNSFVTMRSAAILTWKRPSWPLVYRLTLSTRIVSSRWLADTWRIC